MKATRDPALTPEVPWGAALRMLLVWMPIIGYLRLFLPPQKIYDTHLQQALQDWLGCWFLLAATFALELTVRQVGFGKPTTIRGVTILLGATVAAGALLAAFYWWDSETIVNPTS